MRGRRRTGPAVAIAVAIALALAFGGCEKLDRNMYDNPAFRPQEEPVRLPPAGSVPTKGRERIPALEEARTLRNPAASDAETLAKGKKLYGIFCAPCHGEGGAGDGPVGKKYVPTPADLRPSGHGAHHPDGELFLVVTAGRGGMPAFRADLTPTERWRIVTYLRTLR